MGNNGGWKEGEGQIKGQSENGSERGLLKTR